ncbi:MAG: DNA alkylation repair protein [Patescibacteria group bacterium]
MALKLWDSKIHEARILAGFIDELDKVTEKQMDKWASQFDSWDVCDQVCANLFDKTPFAYKKAKEWTSKKEEFYKRAGFALMAALAWHDKEVSDKKLMEFFPYIKKHAIDERNYVKKAVNWALRQIGKKRESLKKPAIKCAEEILKLYPNSKSAKFIANDAIRELKKR